MAERPIFIPWPSGLRLVKELSFSFVWSPGFAPVQKKKNIRALHEAASAKGYSPVLEVSTKSDVRVGERLSAFNLKVESKELGMIPLECAFQGSKVFENGGPYIDLYTVDARSARKDPRLRNSGRLIEFRFGGFTFPNEPKTAFYDWLYITAIFPHREFLTRLKKYAGFTDIEFNPEKSVNCQARSCAMFVAMMTKGILETAIKTPSSFIEAVMPDSFAQPHSRDSVQGKLL
jgi:hypothetical protein